MPESITETPMPAPAGVSAGSPSAARRVYADPAAASPVAATGASRESDDTVDEHASDDRPSRSVSMISPLMPGRSPSSLPDTVRTRFLTEVRTPGAADAITRTWPWPPLSTQRRDALSSFAADDGDEIEQRRPLTPAVTGFIGASRRGSSWADGVAVEHRTTAAARNRANERRVHIAAARSQEQRRASAARASESRR